MTWVEASRSLRLGKFQIYVVHVPLDFLMFMIETPSDFVHLGACLNQVKGEWKLLYSTISILGSKRTKLGLRDFINLGDFVQIIDVDQVCCVNVFFHGMTFVFAPSLSKGSMVADGSVGLL